MDWNWANIVSSIISIVTFIGVLFVVVFRGGKILTNFLERKIEDKYKIKGEFDKLSGGHIEMAKKVNELDGKFNGTVEKIFIEMKDMRGDFYEKIEHVYNKIDYIKNRVDEKFDEQNKQINQIMLTNTMDNVKIMNKLDILLKKDG